MTHQLKTLPFLLACTLATHFAYASSETTGDAGLTLYPKNGTAPKAPNMNEIAIGSGSNATGAVDTANPKKPPLANIAIGVDSNASGVAKFDPTDPKKLIALPTNIAIGSSSNASGAAGSSNIAVGTGAKVGKNVTDGIALGTGAKAHGRNDKDEGTNIAIGREALTGNLNDTGSRVNTTVKNGISIGYKANVGGTTQFSDKEISDQKIQDGIAIGRNSRAQSNSIRIGSYDDAQRPINENNRFGTTSVGHNVENEGNYSTVFGTNSKIDVDATGASDMRGAFSSINGSLNTVTATDRGTDTGKGFSKEINGVAVSVSGSANQITDSNGVTVMGTGNTIIGAYGTGLTETEVQGAVKTNDLTSLRDAKKDLGSVSVMGGRNRIENSTFATVNGSSNDIKDSRHLLLTGNKNIISGTADKASNNIIQGEKHNFANSESNIVLGFQTDNSNRVTGLKNSAIIGSKYKLADNVKNSAILGDNSEVTASNALALGEGTSVSKEGGVALGQSSVADRAMIVQTAAYVPANATTAQAQAVQNTVAGKLGAVSVGNSANTRQITNVAAGSQDSDAVNVAQLKAVHVQSTNSINSLDTRVSDVENNLSSLNRAESHLNGRMNRMESNLAQTDRKLRAGIAGATSLSFLQQPQHAGQSMISVGVGGYRDATAIAVGLSGNTEKNISYRMGVSVNNRKDMNWGGSVGYAW